MIQEFLLKKLKGKLKAKMKKQKKNLLVTLADENYVEQAKQLFSSVYWNAGWKGDYMLLAHKIPEKKLRWFRNKGILVKKCELIDKKNIYPKSVILCKFYMFTLEFKKWKNVIYLDADMIARASLDELIKVKGFASILNHLINNKLIDQFKTPSQIERKTYIKLKKRYDMNAPAFKAGVMVFNTDIIEKNTFLKLIELFEQYRGLHKSGVEDQLILNLFFYKKWKKLPIVYHSEIADFKFVNFKKIKAIVIHSKENNKLFCKEKKFNLSKADEINLKKIQIPKKFKQSEVKNYSLYLKIRSIFYLPNWIRFIDRTFGLIGIFLYDHIPSLYFALKKLKEKLKK